MLKVIFQYCVCVFTVLFPDSKQRPLLGKPQRDGGGWTKVASEGPLGCQV